MANGRLRIARIAGVPLHVHPSWLAVYGLITWTLAVGYFPHVLPGLGAPAYWLGGLVAALLLFASVLLHELSHAVVAGALGLRVQGITLHVFGGVSELEEEPPTPVTEALIAAAGPLTSFLIAGGLWTLRATGLVTTGWAGAVARYLILVNLALALFNLIPGLPLDGGRLLRAAVWRWTGVLGQATRVASTSGVGFAYVLMGLGILQTLSGLFLDGVWLVLIGLFLRQAADATYSHAALRDTLGRVRVRDVMSRDVASAGPDTSVTDLAKAFALHHYTSFPVVEGGTLRGIVSIHEVHGLPTDRWGETTVRTLMRPVTDDLTTSPDATALEALAKVSRNGVGRLAVLDDGNLVGYLSLKDITSVLVLRGLTTGARAGRHQAGPASKAA